MDWWDYRYYFSFSLSAIKDGIRIIKVDLSKVEINVWQEYLTKTANLFIDEIVNDLPNGFHDSRLKSIFIDYESDKIIMRLDVWVGDLHDPNVSAQRIWQDRVLRGV